MEYSLTTRTKLAMFSLASLLVLPWPLPAEDTQSVLATVEGHNITEADIAGNIAGQMAQINNQIYQAKKRAIDTLITEQLLDREAKKRGLSREQLLQQEVNAKVAPVSDAEVKQVYDNFKARLGNKSLDEVKPQIVQQLQSNKLQQQQQEFTRSLRKAAAVKVLLKPPVVNIALDGAPVRGKPDAPVTLVEFSDFQ
ncbi:MAG TPA: hypothetical protein VGX03_23620 [Candidatus Binatia bacterium]|nr:hypothetical protein [Candidatus Binatia bacterium]